MRSKTIDKVRTVVAQVEKGMPLKKAVQKNKISLNSYYKYLREREEKQQPIHINYEVPGSDEAAMELKRYDEAVMELKRYSDKDKVTVPKNFVFVGDTDSCLDFIRKFS